MKKQTTLFIWLALTVVSHHLQAQNLIGLGGGQEYSYNKLIVKSPLFSSGYLLAEDSIKYPLKQVWYYQVDGEYFKRRVLSGGGYEFLYRELEGNIELYSAIRTTTSYNATTGVPTSTSGKLNFYSKGGAGFKKVNGKNLRNDLADCEACLEEVKKGKTLSVISGIGLTVGLGIFVGSAIKNLSEKPEPNDSASIPAGAIIGPIICFTPWILSGPKRQHYNNAIMIYNEQN